MRRHPEQDLQKAIVRGLRAALPHGWIVHHSANAPRSAIAGGIQKAMGALKGFPDLVVIGPDDTYFLELKAGKGRLSPEQMNVRDRLTDLGRPYGLIRSWEDLVQFASDHGWPWRVAA